MDLAFRQLGALAAARRLGNTLDSQAASNAADGAVAPVPATNDTVSKPLEALRAVIPATMITLYSGIVIPLQGFAINSGAAGRAATNAALAKQYGADTAGLETAIKALTVETSAWVEIRILFAIAATIAVLIYSYRQAQTVDGQRVILEPLVTTLAFAAWAAASPGSFLAAYLNAEQYQIIPLAIAGLMAIVLFAFSSTTLSKKVPSPQQ